MEVVVLLLIVLLVFALPLAALIAWRKTRGEMRALIERVNALESRMTDAHAEATRTRADRPRHEPAPEPAPPAEPPAPVVRPTAPVPSPPSLFKPPPPPPPPAASPPLPAAAAAPGGPSASVPRAIAWLVGGNLVARVGVVILFFGIAFFLNYAIDQGWLPVPVRLALAAAGGLGLLATGWRLQPRRREYGLVLQGGGVGIIYLTAFAGVALYGLLPAGVGFVAMVVLVMLAGGLAVTQRAQGLAVLATLGGFLAPVLVGQDGSHVTLFAYYLALDLGIVAMAWFRAWRVLNLLGFAFTFVVSAAWGGRFYEPGFFATTEPFLILFFLLFVAVPVLFARRRQVQGLGMVDGTLIFGVPLTAMALQAGLVRDTEYGMAISALAASGIYAWIAIVLLRRPDRVFRMVADAFTGLAVALGTLAVPLAVDGQWTGAAWAAEGAALLWVGLRQNQRLARASGLALQAVAGAVFWSAAQGAGLAADAPPVLNSIFVGAMLVGVAGVVSAWHIDRSPAPSPELSGVTPMLLGWGLLWCVGGGVHEIEAFVPSGDRLAALVGLAVATAVVLAVLRRVLAWPRLGLPAVALLPALIILAVAWSADLAHPLAGWGRAAWLPALVVHYWLLRRLEAEWPRELVRLWHALGFLLVVWLASWELAWVVGRLAGTPSAWRDVAAILVPIGALVAVPRLSARGGWPFGPFVEPFRVALVGVAAITIGWVGMMSVRAGLPAPLPYVPLLNPIELVQLAAIVVVARASWLWRAGVSRRLRWAAAPAAAFVALNGAVARAVHVFAGVAFDLEALWVSVTYQTSVSITWTAAALLAMVWGARAKARPAWFAGVMLVAAVVAKLFLVDLSDVGTVARIVSFIVVGLMILLIGYLSPLPPPARRTDA